MGIEEKLPSGVLLTTVEGVAGYMRKKTENYDRWISGLAKIQAKMRETYGK